MSTIADLVAVAIFAAARATGADPIAVASGVRMLPGQKDEALFAISHARAYAAMALRAKTKYLPAMICRMVQAGGTEAAIDVYLSKLSKKVNDGNLAWWREETFEEVMKAIDWQLARSPIEEPRPVAPAAPEQPQGRPFISDRQARAYADLQRAVQNTARITK